MIKSEICQDSFTYPKLMKSKESSFIVLFTNPNTGTVVYQRALHPSIGYHSNGWMSGSFEDFNLPITLVNE
jgi:hypothetical protein